MYISQIGRGMDRVAGERNSTPGYYPTQEVLNIVSKVEHDTEDAGIRQSIHFSTGVISRIERQLTLGCTVVADSKLIYGALNHDACSRLPSRIECFMDDPAVVSFATQKRITRAEIAVERALSLPGPKLIVVGSAPMALNRLLQIHAQAPLREVCIIAAANGFANIVELKERLWESGLPCIVVRGRRGGPAAAISITNALIDGALSKL